MPEVTGSREAGRTGTPHTPAPGRLLALTIALVGVVSAAVVAAPPAGLLDPAMRKPSPPLTVRTASGELQLDRLHGGVVLVDFMTTVCPACRQASRGIQGIFAELGPKGLNAVGVALDVDSQQALDNYALALGLTFSFGTASRPDILQFLQHPAGRPFLVPTLVLLDRQGRISAVEVGWNGEEALRTRILALLAEPAGR